MTDLSARGYPAGEKLRIEKGSAERACRRESRMAREMLCIGKGDCRESLAAGRAAAERACRRERCSASGTMLAETTPDSVKSLPPSGISDSIRVLPAEGPLDSSESVPRSQAAKLAYHTR